MTPHVHYNPTQTSAQTPSHTAHRLLYAEAARRGEYIESYDVPGAYARAPAGPDFQFRLTQPRRSDGSFTKPGHDVLIVNAQQGVPDAGHNLGWQSLSSEPSAFFIQSANKRQYARLLATTDDFILSSNHRPFLHRLRQQLFDEWQISIQVPVTQHAGLKISRTPTSISISAPKHIQSALTLAGMTTCNHAKTPQDPNHDLTARRPNEDPLSPTDHALYRRIVGIARYIADTVGYEIAYTTSALAAHLNNPCARHQQALHRLLRYLAGNRNMSITYSQDPTHPSARFMAYCDSDWAGCTDSRPSRSGTAIQFSGDLIHWMSKMQATVSDSSTEAEYVAAATASNQVQWLRMLAKEWHIDLSAKPTPLFLTHKPLEPTQLRIDNSGAIAMITANSPTRRSKHIDIKLHAINERARRGIIVPTKVHTAHQKADLLTKPLQRVKFLHSLSIIRNARPNPAELSRGVAAQDHSCNSAEVKRVRFADVPHAWRH